MDMLRSALALLILTGPAFAGEPARTDLDKLHYLDKLHSVAAPGPMALEPEDELDDCDLVDLDLDSDLDDLLEPSPETGSGRLYALLPTRDALAFRSWPADLDQGNPDHRQVMDLVERNIIPVEDLRFHPGTRVTRYELLDWLTQVEDWVRVAQTGLSLSTRFTIAKRNSPIGLVLRTGLASPVQRLDGDVWVDRPFLLRVLDGLERCWGTEVLAGRPRLTRDFLPDRVQVALWLRAVAEDLFNSGREPADRKSLDPRSLAHLPVLLALLEDPSWRAREMAHRVLAGTDTAVLATLMAGHKGQWFRDPVVLQTLPETAVKLALAPGDTAAGELRDAMRILRGLRSTLLDMRFLRAGHEALARIPMEQPLPPRLLGAMVDVIAARGWTEQLDGLLQWGMPALDAIIPYIEQDSLDRIWTERMPYSIEAGWDTRGLGVVAQLRTLVRDPRIPPGTRASALDRLDRLGETMPREQMRPLGMLPQDPDPAQIRLAGVALRVMARQPLPPPAPVRPPADDAELQRALAAVHTYQLYLAIALVVLALIAFLHIAVIVPMMLLRLLRRLRALLTAHEGPPCKMP